jgi:hypothetical protein
MHDQAAGLPADHEIRGLLEDALAVLEDPDAGGYAATKAAEAIRARLDETAAEPPVLPWWQHQPCPPWCVATKDGRGHRAADGVPDRNHWSEWEGKVNLSLVDVSLAELRECALHDEDPEPEYASVTLSQHYRETDPRILLGQSERPHVWDLTVSEARALADQLVKAADLAEGHQGGAA